MPIYEFRCQDCGHVLEALRRMGQGADGLECPACGSTKLAQILSVFAAGRSGASASAPCGAPASSCGSSGGG